MFDNLQKFVMAERKIEEKNRIRSFKMTLSSKFEFDRVLSQLRKIQIKYGMQRGGTY